MTLSKRIKMARESVPEFQGETGRTAFADAIGVSYETVRLWETKPNLEVIRPYNADKIADKTGVRKSWLLTGEGRMFDGGEDVPSEAEVIRLARMLPRSQRLNVAARIISDAREDETE